MGVRPIVWDAIRHELRAVADQSPLMVWITDADGYCFYVNQRWYDFTGQEPGAAEDRGWSHAIHGEDRGEVLEGCQRAIRLGLPYQTEYRLCRHDKAFSWVVAAGHPYFDAHGERAGFIGSNASHEMLTAAHARPGSMLTPREREIMKLIAVGKTSGEIGAILGIVPRTVEQHVRSASFKLGTINRVQTVVEAIRRKEITV